jgi:UDP-N-acetylmuramate--alanine ligase
MSETMGEAADKTANKTMDKTVSRVHFIGIGGSGMSGIALVAHERGLVVTGSDLKETRYMRSLLRANVQVTVGHDAANVADPTIDVVVVSSAIPAKNPEYRAAIERELEIWPRAQMLSYLSRGQQTLAVAGTHGKTTTTSMLATTLDRLGADPTFLIGGVVDGYDSTARVGGGDFFVVEADESDSSFTWLDPTLAIITNIETDHLDYYPSIDEILVAFGSFLGKLASDGDLIVFDGSPDLIRLARDSRRRVHTYGTSENVSFRCVPESARNFDVVFADGQRCSLSLPASPGLHNMLNATAVMAALDVLGFERDAAAAALSAFSGVRRRFDHIGEAGGVTVVDDYGHHPTEIAATLAAAAELGYRRVHVLFQPHRYTRTRALFDDFTRAFDNADTISLMDIYPAGEAPIPGVNSEVLAEAVREYVRGRAGEGADGVRGCADGGADGGDPAAIVRTIRHRTDVPAAMAAIGEPGDLIITMGAGDVTALAPLILEALAQREQKRGGGEQEDAPQRQDNGASENKAQKAAHPPHKNTGREHGDAGF